MRLASAKSSQRKRYLAPSARRFVNPEKQLERLATLAPIRSRSFFAAQDTRDILVISAMTGPVHGERIRRNAQCLHFPVVVVVFRELPVLDPVEGRPADLHRSALAD